MLICGEKVSLADSDIKIIIDLIVLIHISNKFPKLSHIK